MEEVREFEFREGLTAKALGAEYRKIMDPTKNSLENQLLKEQFLHDMVKYYGRGDRKFPGFEAAKKVLSFEHIKNISEGLKHHDLNTQNEWRRRCSLKEILLPGANLRHCLTPENYYQLQDTDMYVGLNWLREQWMQSDRPQKSAIRYFLMPVVYALKFRKLEGESGEKKVDQKDFDTMRNQLGFLLTDCVKTQKKPVIVLGVLNTDRGHYINYFCAWNPQKKKVTIFILDPSAEKENEKRPLEEFYAQVMGKMLELKADIEIQYLSCSVTQQIRERDCGFLVLENLENCLAGGELFFLSKDNQIEFNPSALTVNGNNHKSIYYKEHKYCYSSKILEDDLKVRHRWALRFKQRSESDNNLIVYHNLKQPPTVDAAFDVPFSQDPYDYDQQVRDQFKGDVLGQIRNEIYAILSSHIPGGRGRTVVEECVFQYKEEGILPTKNKEKIREYTGHVKTSILKSNIRIQGVNYDLATIEETFGKLEDEVELILLDSLKPVFADELYAHFLPYIDSFKWKEDYDLQSTADIVSRVVSDFFENPAIKEIAQRLDKAKRSEIRGTLVELADQKVSPVAEAHAKARANMMISKVTAICQEVEKTLFSEKLPLVTRLSLTQNQVRTAVLNASPTLKVAYRQFPMIQEKINQGIDQYFERVLRNLLFREIEAFIMNSPINDLLGPEESEQRQLWLKNAFLNRILKPENGLSLGPQRTQCFMDVLNTSLKGEVDRPQKLSQEFQGSLEFLAGCLQLLDDRLETQIAAIQEFKQRLEAHIGFIHTARQEKKFEVFEKEIRQRLNLVLKEFNDFVMKLAPLFDAGNISPHHSTYCLRPFFARLFNLPVQIKGNTPSVVCELDQLKSIDKAIKQKLDPVLNKGVAGSIRVLPAQCVSNVPFLAQPGKINYQTVTALNLGLLISMLHRIDTDMCDNSGWGGYWRNCLKPLRNQLVAFLAKLPNGTTIETSLALDKRAELLAIFEAKAVKEGIAEFKDDVDTGPLSAMLELIQALKDGDLGPVPPLERLNSNTK